MTGLYSATVGATLKMIVMKFEGRIKAGLGKAVKGRWIYDEKERMKHTK